MLSREKIRIENARLYPAEIVDELRTALSKGTKLQADGARKHFYDVDYAGRTFFIHISPASGSVTLIATWVRERSSADVKQDGQSPWWRRITAHLHPA